MIERFERGYLVDSNGDTTQKDFEALKIAISAVQELQEYHKTGMTHREVIKMQHGYAVKMTDLEDYQQIGTLEEVREAVERSQKKFTNIKGDKLRFGTCPRCRNRISNVEGGNYCQNCGQALDWNISEKWRLERKSADEDFKK